jgi:hypothetical protein
MSPLRSLLGEFGLLPPQRLCDISAYTLEVSLSIGLEYLEEDNEDIPLVYFEGILLEYTGEDEDMLENPEECEDDLLEYPEESEDLSEYCEDILLEYPEDSEDLSEYCEDILLKYPEDGEDILLEYPEDSLDILLEYPEDIPPRTLTPLRLSDRAFAPSTPMLFASIFSV